MRQASEYQKQLDAFVRHGSINSIPFVKLLEAETLSLRPNLHEPTAKAYRDAVGAVARCGFRLCKGLACEKAGQYMLEQGEKAVSSDYLTEAWNEFLEYGAVAKLTRMETKWRNLCSHRSAIAKAENVLQVGTTSRLGETRFRSIA
jgi:hypothetical protein